MRLTVLVVIVIFSTMLSRPSSTVACVSAPRVGEQVTIGSEKVVIVWDARTHTEHFIRSAEFESTGKDFGFLVPTPSPPKLAEVDDDIFDQMASTEPVPHVSTRTLAGSTKGIPVMPAAAGVQVLRRQRVAGYDAVVLRADNVAALTRWLRKHHYEVRPEFTTWLRPYVAKHWIITAFKIVKDENGNSSANLSAVRMSFKTPHPFFPYKEPTDQRAAGKFATSRVLRVYCLSSAPMDGKLDGDATRWPGRALWKYHYSNGNSVEISQLTDDLKLRRSQLPRNLWLTTFDDTSSPRPGVADLYFQPRRIAKTSFSSR